jgi:hypothetical protein
LIARDSELEAAMWLTPEEAIWERKLGELGRRLNAIVTTTAIAGTLRQFDRLVGDLGSPPTSSGRCLVLLETTNRNREANLGLQLRLPTGANEQGALELLTHRGVLARAGSRVERVGDVVELPRQGLVALSFLVHGARSFDGAAFKEQGEEFLARAVAQSGQTADYGRLIVMLSTRQIAAGCVMHKIVTEGMSGLGGCLHLNHKFWTGIEEAAPRIRPELMARVLQWQYDVFCAMSGATDAGTA